MRRAIAFLTVAILISGCSNQVEIGEAMSNGTGTSIDLGLNSCGGTYEVDIAETPESVTIKVKDQRSPISFGGDACQDGWAIELSEPLGDRELIDGSTGESMVVRYEPWNQRRYSEGEFRAALVITVECIVEADPELEASVVEGANGPELRVEPYDVPDGESRMDPTADCSETHLEPLRR